MEYSEYKDTNVSYIGSVPFSWKIAKIKNISEFMPKADLSSLCPEDEVTFAPMECIKKGHFENHSRKLKDIDGSYTQFAEGDIVFAKVTPCFENGNLSIMNNLFSGVGFGSSELFVLRPTHLLDRYLFYFLQHNGFINAACATMTGTGGLKRVSSDFVKNCFIPIPSSDEQSSIADYLDRKVSRIDSIIEETRASIEEYKAWKSSIIYEAVTKGLDPTAEMKDSGIDIIGYIPKHWDYVPLKMAFDNSYGSAVRVGPFGSALSGSDIIDEGVWVYNQRAVLDNNYQTNNTFVSPEKAKELINFSVYPGDILITTRGSIGKVSIVPENAPKGILHPCIIRFRTNKNLINDRLLSILFNDSDFMLRQMRRMSNSTTIDVLYSYSLKELRIPFIPVDEQKSITDFLEKKVKDIDSLISEKESLITDLEAYKKSLIFEVVTGKRKVV